LSSLTFAIAGCAVNRAIGDRKLLLAIVIRLKEDTLTRAIAYTRPIQGNSLSALRFIHFAKRGNENALSPTLADFGAVKLYRLLCTAIGLGEQSLSSLTFAVAGCAVNGAVSDRNILSAIVIPLKENTLTTAITHTRAVEGNILSALGFIRFAKRGNENSLIGTVTDLSIIKAQGLLCAAISLGEQSLSSLTLAVNRCTANRAIGDRNILSAIVIRLKENSLTDAVAYCVAIGSEFLLSVLRGLDENPLATTITNRVAIDI
jgi:hypothetical protein